MFKQLCFALAVAFAAPAIAADVADPRIGQVAPDFLTKDINGEKQSLSQHKGKVVVLEWNNPGCPFVKKFYDTGKMQALQADAAGKGVVWLTFNSSAEGKQGFMNADEAKKYVADQKAAPSAYILDGLGRLGKQFKASATPNMYVIDQKGNFAYIGAIDDKPTPSASDIEGATNYVVNAVDALLANKKVEVNSTKPYGCGVKYAEPIDKL